MFNTFFCTVCIIGCIGLVFKYFFECLIRFCNVEGVFSLFNIVFNIFYLYSFQFKFSSSTLVLRSIQVDYVFSIMMLAYVGPNKYMFINESG